MQSGRHGWSTGWDRWDPWLSSGGGRPVVALWACFDHPSVPSGHTPDTARAGLRLRGPRHDRPASGLGLPPVRWRTKSLVTRHGAYRTRGPCRLPAALRGARTVHLRADVCLAIPAVVVGFSDEANRIALVEVAGVQRNVNVGLLDGSESAVAPGDWVLVHVGFAIAKVDEAEALATRALLEQMGAGYEQELEDLKAS